MFSGCGIGEYGIEQAYAGYFKSTRFSAESEPKECRQRRKRTTDKREVLLRPRGERHPLCIGYAEIDKYASAVYKYHFPEHRNYGDATAIIPDELPDFDFLIAGFPCQAFSIAGKRQGFNEARGTLFFEIARVLSHKRPGHFLLENVKGLDSHESGKTVGEIFRILGELGYFVEKTVLNSKDYGVPQNRERVFFIGHLGGECGREILSVGEDGQEPDGALYGLRGEVRAEGAVGYEGSDLFNKSLPQDGQNGHLYQGTATGINMPSRGPEPRADGLACTVKAGESGTKNLVQISEGRQGERVYDSDGLAAGLTASATGGTKNNFYRVGTLRTHKDGEGFREISGDVSPTLNARAREDGSGQAVIEFNQRIRRLTPVECERLQGLPDDWTRYGLFDEKEQEISDTQRYKMCGNGFTANVIKAQILALLDAGCL